MFLALTVTTSRGPACFSAPRQILDLEFYCYFTEREYFPSALSGHHGEPGAQQHPSGHQGLPVFAGKNKDAFHEPNGKLHIRLPYSRPVFNLFQCKAQPASTPGSADTATLTSGAERT